MKEPVVVVQHRQRHAVARTRFQPNQPAQLGQCPRFDGHNSARARGYFLQARNSMIKLRPPSGFWKPERGQSPVFLPTAIPLEAVPSPTVESGPEILTKWLSLRKSGSNTPRVLNVAASSSGAFSSCSR